jgi:hypothetical protein
MPLFLAIICRDQVIVSFLRVLTNVLNYYFLLFIKNLFDLVHVLCKMNAIENPK